jgi:hypothetical protein
VHYSTGQYRQANGYQTIDEERVDDDDNGNGKSNIEDREPSASNTCPRSFHTITTIHIHHLPSPPPTSTTTTTFLYN